MKNKLFGENIILKIDIRMMKFPVFKSPHERGDFYVRKKHFWNQCKSNFTSEFSIRIFKLLLLSFSTIIVYQLNFGLNVTFLLV